MTIRRATSADAETVAHIHVESWKVAYRGIMPDDVIARTDLAYRTRFWKERLVDQVWPVLLLETDGRPVAFCHMIPTDDPGDDPARVGHITSIHVLPQQRGRGHGRTLLDYVRDEFRRREFRELTLWVLEGNRDARRFYEKHGFRADGGRRTYSRTDVRTNVPEVRYRTRL